MDADQTQENLTEPTTDQQRDRFLRRCLLAVLGVSLVLQIVGLAAPGWLVLSPENSSVSSGLFYYKQCIDGMCETTSYIKQYNEAMEKSSSTQDKASIRASFCLGVLRTMLGPIVSFSLCLITFLVLLYLTKKKQIIRHVLYHLSPMLSVAGLIMGETIYVFLVTTDLFVKTNDSNVVKFPYAMFFYMLACIQVFGAVILMAILYRRETTTANTQRGDGDASQLYTRFDNGASN